MAFKRYNPGCPCCSAACENLCFVVTGCGEPISGATVRVFETGVPGTTLATGTTDANGEVCYDLSAHASKSLSYTSTPPDTTDYAAVTEVLVGNWCGRTVTVVHPPATIPGTPGEAGGTVNVLFTRCNGTTPWASATVEIKVSFSVIATGTTDANGRVSFDLVDDGSNAYYVRAYRPTDSAPLNSATFTLSAGQCADVHMRITHNDLLPCNPDVEAVITERDCSDAGADVQKRCCVDCHPDTIPGALDLSTTDGPACAGDACGFAAADTTITYGATIGGDAWNGIVNVCAGPLSRWSFNYSMRCSGSGVQLRITTPAFVLCEKRVIGDFGAVTRYQLRDTGDRFNLTYDSGWVTAATLTCDPFAATFTMPTKTWTYYRVDPFTGGIDLTTTDGTLTIPSHTVTVTQP